LLKKKPQWKPLLKLSWRLRLRQKLRLLKRLFRQRRPLQRPLRKKPQLLKSPKVLMRKVCPRQSGASDYR